MDTIKEKLNKSFDIMKGSFGYKNPMEAPKLEKVVISVGTGKESKNDKKRNEFVQAQLAKITGQKPALKQAKKSIAQFKLREGDHVGVAVTLRGEKMLSFVDKLINIAFPRTKDFRGLDIKALDDVGNLTIGIKEHTIFPETGDEEIRNIFGMAITFVTTAKTKKEAKEFFIHIGIPFKKEIVK